MPRHFEGSSCVREPSHREFAAGTPCGPGNGWDLLRGRIVTDQDARDHQADATVPQAPAWSAHAPFRPAHVPRRGDLRSPFGRQCPPAQAATVSSGAIGRSKRAGWATAGRPYMRGASHSESQHHNSLHAKCTAVDGSGTLTAR